MPDPRIHDVERTIPRTATAPNPSGSILAANQHRGDVEIVNISDKPVEPIFLSRGGIALIGFGIALTTYGSSYRIGTNNMFYGVINADTCDVSIVVTRSREITNPVTPTATWPWAS